MSSLANQAFIDEIEKIARQSYLTEEEQKAVDKGGWDPLSRIFMGTAGFSVAASAAPLAAKAGSPSPTVYHGTTLQSADNILNTAVATEYTEGKRAFKGLATRFAGKAGRINEMMLAEEVGRTVDRLGVKLSESELSDLVMDAKHKITTTSFLHSIQDQLPERGTWNYVNQMRFKGSPMQALFGRQIDPDDFRDYVSFRNGAARVDYDATRIAQDSAEKFLRRKGVAPEVVEQVSGELKKNLKWSGKRIYFGWHPATVAVWGEEGFKEANWMMRKAMEQSSKDKKRQMVESVLDVYTFGARHEAAEIKKLVSHRPQKTTTMTLSEASEKISALRKAGAEKSVVFGAKVPAGSLRWMTDFPGLSTLMSINPGIKFSVANFLPNYDPARDLSIHVDVPSEHFRSIDIIDTKTGQFERINIKGFGSPKVKPSAYLKGLARAAPFAALAAVGLDLVQSSIRKEDTYLRKALTGRLALLPSKKNPSVKRWQKVASAKGEALGALKALLPGIVGGAIAGTAAEAAVEKALPAKEMKDMNKAQAAAYQAARTSAMAVPAFLAGAALGASPIYLKNLIKGRKSSVVDHLLAYGLGTMGAATAAQAVQSTDMTRRGYPPEMSTALNVPLSTEKGRKLTDKYPQAAAVIPIAASAATIPVLLYAARKHYPGHYLKLKGQAKALGSSISAVEDAMRKTSSIRLPPYVVAELSKIAQVADLPCFAALDKLANSMMGYGGMNAAGAQMVPPPNVSPGVGGATNMPGMSLHCDKCNAELKQMAKHCPECGCRLKKLLDMKAIDKKLDSSVAAEKQVPEGDRLETGPTGGEASEAEELSEGSYSDGGKYAAAPRDKSFIKRLPRGAQAPAGAAVLLTSLYGGNEVRKMISEGNSQDQPHAYSQVRGYKTAAARLGNPVMRIRRESWKTMAPSDALGRIKDSTRKFTSTRLSKV
jgi:hypothetical protein